MIVSVPVYATRSRAGVSVLSLYIVSLMLLLEMLRPVRKIPASRRMETSMCQEQQGARCRALTSRKNGLPARLENRSSRCAPRAYRPEAGESIRLPCAVGAESHQKECGLRDC